MVLKKVKIYLMHGLLGLETHFWCRIGSKCKCGYFCKKSLLLHLSNVLKV